MNAKKSSFLFSCGLALLLTIGFFNAKSPRNTESFMLAEVQTTTLETPDDALIPPANVPLNLMPNSEGTGFVMPVGFLSPFEHDSRATFHPHGEQVCASGCAASNHPTPELALDMFQDLLAEFSTQPMNEHSLALEALLYYGKQTSDLIRQHGASPLDSSHERFLLNELQKTHTKVSIRIVDEFGIVRAWNEPTDVPFNRRHVFDLEGENLQSLVASGTVKRVGLYHLWTRL